MISSNPINIFREGNFVSIAGVPAMRKLRIESINFSGVTVFGKSEMGGADHTFTVAGTSPAIAYVETGSFVDTATGEEVKERAPRGHYDAILKTPKIPTGTFSISDFGDLNELPYTYAAKWVKENCVSRGTKEKVQGVRGKASEVFEKIF